MKIAVIGYGRLGKVFVSLLSKKGHEVWIGLRDPTKDVSSDLDPKSIPTSIEDAIDKADVVMFATPWQAAIDLARNSRNSLSKKTIIDCTNPLKPELAGLEKIESGSVAMEIASILPSAQIFKAFNSLGAMVFAKCVELDQKTPMYFCGKGDRSVIAEMSLALGVEPLDLGDLQFSQAVENLAFVWIISAFKLQFGLTHRFTILKS